MKKIDNNENKEYCSTCSKCCCSKYPGAYAPGQVSLKQIEQLLKDKKASFWMCYKTDKTGFLRPRNVPIDKYKRITYGVAGDCCNLTKKGCSLPFDERPYECQALVPNKNPRECKEGISLEKVVGYWKLSNKFQKIVDKLGIDIEKELEF